jgi:uridine kinase
MKKPVEAVREAVLGSRQSDVNRVIIVALDGRSGAGKSTLANLIAPDLNAVVVHVDDFYRDMPDGDRRELSPSQGVDRYFDWQRLRDEALTPLVRREVARFQRFNWIDGQGLIGSVTVEARDVVILEGVYSARPELDHLVDLRVLVKLADRKRLQRRDARSRTVSRHDPHGWDARWDAAERIYFDTIRLPSSFDLIVAGDA